MKIKIYKAIIFLVLLYGCETWSLILRKACRIRAFKKNDPEANVLAQAG